MEVIGSLAVGHLFDGRPIRGRYQCIAVPLGLSIYCNCLALASRYVEVMGSLAGGSLFAGRLIRGRYQCIAAPLGLSIYSTCHGLASRIGVPVYPADGNPLNPAWSSDHSKFTNLTSRGQASAGADLGGRQLTCILS